MLKFVRTRSSSVAAALLVSLLSLQLPHTADADHDSHGSLALFAHDPSTHAIGKQAPGGEAPPLHCVVCHIARSFRPQTAASSPPVPVVSTRTLVHIDVFTAARPAVVAQPPLRSPPPPSPLATLA
jgi:hypothetical protein